MSKALLIAQQHANPRWADLLFFYPGRNTNTEYVTRAVGTNGASPTYATPGRVQSQARSFTSSTATSVDIAHNSVFNIPSGDFTFEGWINVSSSASSGGDMLSKGNTANVIPFLLYFNITQGGSPFLSFFASTNGTTWNVVSNLQVISPVNISLNNWRHWAVVRNGTRIQAFYNGIRVDDVVAGSTAALHTNTDPIRVGNSGFAAGPSYSVEDVAIWKYARFTADYTPSRLALPRSLVSGVRPASIIGMAFDSANYESAKLSILNGNQTVRRIGGTGAACARGTVSKSSGKWYTEVRVDTLSSAAEIGVSDSSFNFNNSAGQYLGQTAGTWSYASSGTRYNNNVGTAGYANYGAGSVIGIAWDQSTGKLWFAKDGVWQGGGDPAAGTSPAYSNCTATIWPGVAIYGVGARVSIRDTTQFSYSPPSGFSAWQ